MLITPDSRETLQLYHHNGSEPRQLAQLAWSHTRGPVVLHAPAPATLINGEVALLANTSYVDYIPGNTDAEGSNLAQLLGAAGLNVYPFTDISLNGLSNALVGGRSLLIPELEKGDFYAALSAASRTLLRDYVHNGGRLLCCYSANIPALFNGLFGWNLQMAGLSDGTLTRGYNGRYSSAPASLTHQSATAVISAGLPPGSQSIYSHSSGSGLAHMPWGDGEVIWLGWDWYGALSNTSDQQAWNSVLQLALRTDLPAVL